MNNWTNKYINKWTKLPNQTNYLHYTSSPNPVSTGNSAFRPTKCKRHPQSSTSPGPIKSQTSQYVYRPSTLPRPHIPLATIPEIRPGPFPNVMRFHPHRHPTPTYYIPPASTLSQHLFAAPIVPTPNVLWCQICVSKDKVIFNIRNS